MSDIAIIGGGASGIAAAIEAAEQGARVTLFEAGKRIGHSVLASGNGRCNFSNAQVDAQAYWNAPFVQRAFEACPPKKVWQWFARLGLLWESESEGRLYPLANKASSVLDVLRFRLDELGVHVECEAEVRQVQQRGSAWEVHCGSGSARCFDAVVVACGNQVTRSLLPQGTRFVARSMRLCALRTNPAAVKGLDNVRVHAAATLLRPKADGSAPEAVAREVGEIQFRQFGVSGIAVFNLSRHAQPDDVVEVDLLPSMAQTRLEAELSARAQRWPLRSAQQQLAGMALPLVSGAVLRHAGLSAQAPFTSQQAAVVAQAFKHYRLQVQGFETRNAQVARGGVAVGQVDAQTMGLKDHPGLFVTGEALDVDGPCGGFNLHWAWTCGLLAGAAAAKEGPHA